MLPNGRGGLYRGRVTIAADRITEVVPHPVDRTAHHDDIDFSPHVALPGFIDLQLNGAFGHDITTDPETMWPIGERLLSQGVTAFLPTVVSSSPQQRSAAYAAIRARPVGYKGATPLGLHIEGPALSPQSAGSHAPAQLIGDAAALADEIIAEADAVALVTVAPEVANAVGAIERLAAAGITLSLGHTAASATQTQRALEAGATAFTHLFNGMGPLHHREVGAVGVALLHPTAHVSIIVDGYHLADDAIRLAWCLAGPGRTFLVTDAMAGMGAPGGAYHLGGVPAQCDETARNNDGSLAGSLLTMAEAACRLRRVTGASWDDLATVTAVNPAALVGDADRGRLEAGKRADIAVVDTALRPVATIIGGEVVYRRLERPAVADAVTSRQVIDSETAGARAGPGLVDQVVKQVVIGVDIGGTTFKAAAFDGTRLGAVRRGRTGANRPAVEVLADVRAVIDDIASADGAEVVGVGIACPGVVDAAAGTVVEAINLNWRDIDVIEGLGRDLTPPVTVEHDVRLAAMAEWETGAGAGADSMLYVSVGTGVASRLFTPVGTERGSGGLAGEMGFIAVGPDRLPLEHVASGRALVAGYQAATGRTLPASEVIAAADRDPDAARLTASAVGALAQGVAAAVCLQDPQIVVMGGGVSAASPAMIDALALRVAELLKPLRLPPPISVAAHGARSGIIGAALHARRTATTPSDEAGPAGHS